MLVNVRRDQGVGNGEAGVEVEGNESGNGSGGDEMLYQSSKTAYYMSKS